MSFKLLFVFSFSLQSYSDIVKYIFHTGVKFQSLLILKLLNNNNLIIEISYIVKVLFIHDDTALYYESLEAC